MFTIEELALPALASPGEETARALRYGYLTACLGQSQALEPASRRVMLFIPGLGGSVKGALSFLERLLPACDPVVGSDLRGFGLNSLHPLPASPYAHLDDLAAFTEQVVNRFQCPVTLCGISLGGASAIHLASRYPQWFDSLVLIAPAFKGAKESFPFSYVLKQLWARVVGGKHHVTTLPYGIRELTRSEELRSDPQYQDRLVVPTDYLLKVSLYNQKAHQLMAEVRCPTMMLVPGKDVVCDPVMMQSGFARLPKTPGNLLKVYDDLYHDVLMEPEMPQLAEDVLAWLARIHGAASLYSTDAVALNND